MTADVSQQDASSPGAQLGLWRLLGPALVCWTITAAVIHRPGTARIVAMCAVAVGAGICFYLIKRTWQREQRSVVGSLLGVVLIGLSVLALVGVRIDTLERARASDFLVTAAEQGGQVTVRATLAGYPERIDGFGDTERAWAHADLTMLDGRLPHVPVSIILWLPEPPPETWASGTPVQLVGSLRSSAPESRAAYEVNVREIAEDDAREDLPAVVQRTIELPAMLRKALREAAEKSPGAALVPGLAVGDTSLVDQPLTDLMLESSLTHLVAVSGSNCALVITAAVWASSRLGAGRRARIFVAAAALGSFVVLVGPDASVQRAAVMAGVLLLSSFSGKSRRALPSLGLAILVLLIVDPWQSIQAGFALSVAATAGILLGVSPFENWLRVRARLPGFLALPIAVACIAQFACSPLLLLLQPGLPVAGVVSNILAAPVAPAGTALGMATMLLLPIHEGIGEAALWFAVWPARWIEASGAFGVALPMGRWYWPGGWPGALLLGGAEALVVGVWIASGGSSSLIGPWRGNFARTPAAQARLRLMAGVSVGLIVAVVIVVPVSVRVGVPRDWTFVACDVGQGDAIMLRDPEEPNSVMLVDTGDDPAKLEACMKLFGVRKVALLVLTHDHLDHYGAMQPVLSYTREVIISPPTREHEKERPVADAIALSDTPFIVGEVDMIGQIGSGLTWQILAPPPAEVYEEPNATSLVLLVDVAGIRLLLLADTGEKEQRWMAQTFPDLEAQVVKVAHHGSKDQNQSFYDALGATISVISVGENNYGHPNRELLKRLGQSGAAALRTDELGSVALSVETNSSSGAVSVVPWAAGKRSEAV